MSFFYFLVTCLLTVAAVLALLPSLVFLLEVVAALLRRPAQEPALPCRIQRWRRPLGLAVVGGLAFSQLMTLYLTPVVYTYMAAIVERWNARRTRRALTPAMQAGD